MQVNLIPTLLDEQERTRAEQVLNACVHCGFCTATCPTYLQAGNELDSPRGRIYLIKEMLEQGVAGTATRTHLDRCLTCLSCETTCPSGVEYHKLLSIGRATSERLAPRGFSARVMRWALRKLLTTRGLFTALMGIARLFTPVLPKRLRRVYFPATSHTDDTALHNGAAAANVGTVVLVKGCVQPTLRPETDAALIKILRHCGLSVSLSSTASCCGAASFHTSGEEEARVLARKNIDDWWARVQGSADDAGGIRAIVSTASGCGAHLKDYPHILADDPKYAEKARILAAMLRDPVELLEQVFAEQAPRLDAAVLKQRLVFHCPCTLQHAQGLNGRVEQLLRAQGVDLPEVTDSHLCCGSAGTYSITQPEMSRKLRANKLDNLLASEPETLLTANIGCQLHLQAGTEKKVRHWLDLLADALPKS